MLTQLLARTAALYLTREPHLTEILISKEPEYLASKNINIGRQARKRNSVCYKNGPLPGDVIYVKRMGDLYRHFGIYAGNDRVIHYAGHGGG